ncbi:MAG: DUF460 domain-containing protein [Promethearchaeia archaeon]
MDTESEFVMGFDILPFHSPRSRTPAKYACVIMREGTVLNEYEEISRRSMLNLVNEIRPKWLCTDNIFEIIPDSKSVIYLIEDLPPSTKLIQVTGVPPRQVTLQRLARQHDIPLSGKPSPLEAARISAQLATQGVGYSLECFSAQTEIQVVRGRRPGRGGQSANRFRRRVQSMIQQMTREIESNLTKSQIEYDISIREADFGYASSRIVAYAPLHVVRGIVDSKHSGDFKVLVDPIRKQTEFVPLEPQPAPKEAKTQYFILGVDPGTTAAICLLTLRGKVQFLDSKKALTRADIIRMVYSKGTPVMVASDVTPVPNMVKKISSTVNADLFTPNSNIPVAEKNEIAREFGDGVNISNAHERDALTAAVFAYRSIIPKLRQIDRKVRDERLEVDRDHLKAMVIRGTPMNEAIARLTKEKAEEEAPPESQEIEQMPEETLDSLRERYKELKDENESLEQRVEDLKSLVDFLRFKENELSHSLDIISKQNYWKVRRDRKIAKKNSEIKRSRQRTHKLEEKIQDLRDLLSKLRGVKRLEMRGDMLAVKRIEKFTQESIQNYIKEVAPLKSGDVLLFDDASGAGPQTAHILAEKGIRAVIIDTPLSHLAENELIEAEIPVIRADEVKLRRVDEFAFIDRSRFERNMANFKKNVHEKARQKREDRLVELVERYRRESSH